MMEVENTNPAIEVAKEVTEDVNIQVSKGDNSSAELILQPSDVDSVRDDDNPSTQLILQSSDLDKVEDDNSLKDDDNSSTKPALLPVSVDTLDDVDEKHNSSQTLTTVEKLEQSEIAKPCENAQSEDRKSPVNGSSREERQSSIYHIKWISRNNHKTPIITQNENGPCPLIAIINVLILKGRVTLPSAVDIVTSEKLMQHLSDCILDSVPKNIPEGTQLNYEQNVHDAMVVLPKLQTGLDVNVRFTGIRDFEYTPECVIFDLLGIPLYHGWLIDPQMTDVVVAVGKCSYNQLVEKIINSHTSQDPDRIAEAMVAESFLNRTASQLTYHGLCELTSSLHESELCVLFRNNHFISLIKHNNVLYQLVTDQGFLNENVVWETLNNIDGDGQFVDANFVLVPPKPFSGVTVPPDIPVDQQIDQDYLVALSLQEEQKQQEKEDLEWEEYKLKNLDASGTLNDEELARRLQVEESQVNLTQRQQQQQQQQPHHQPSFPQITNSVPNAENRNRSRDCVIL